MLTTEQMVNGNGIVVVTLLLHYCDTIKPLSDKTNSHLKYEPPRDKTIKMALRPAKTQISLGIH